MVSTEWSPATKRLVVIGLIIVLLLALYFFRGILPPVAIALVLAYLLKPVADFVEHRTGLPRTAAVLVVFLILLLILAVISVSVVPYLVDRVTAMNVDLQRLVNDVEAFLSQPLTFYRFSFNPQDLLGDVQSTLQGLLQPFATQTVTLLVGVLSSLVWVVAILVIAFYLIKDADRLRGYLDRITPVAYREELGRLREEINLVWKAFFRGQVVLGIIIGFSVWIAMAAVGLPQAGLMGLLAGLLEVIPTIGPILAVIPAILIALTRGSTFLPLSNFWFAILVLAIYLVIQQVESAYLQPRIMGSRLKLHPVIVFTGILLGGMVGGVLGIFLAAPIIATSRVLLSYVYAKLLDQPPFPPEVDEVPEVYPGEIDAILFDLDGTLIETDAEAVETLAGRLQRIKWLLPNGDPAGAARRLLMAGERPATRFLALLDRIGLDDDALDLADRLRRLRGLHDPLHLQPVDGTTDMLRELSNRYYLAIVTTRSHYVAEAYLRQQGLTDTIQVVTGRDDTWRIKPHPSPVCHTAEQLGVATDRCLLVGDSSADIEAARAAGARSVGVLCGFGSREELEDAGADLILECTSDLADWM